MKGILRNMHNLLARGVACIVLTVALSFGSLIAQVQRGKPAFEKKQTFQKTVKRTDGPGERKFQANCSRCHTAPEQLSPRISGTVLRHMRVRALLSPEDEQDILHYLAP